MTTILTIDQSTSSTKALIYDASGRLMDKASLDHRQHYPRPGWVEHNAEEIWQNTLAVLKTVVEKNRGLVQDLACLSVTNQRETVVVFDRRTGRPLHNAIVWQCRRGDPLCSRLVQNGDNEWVQKLTGLKIDTYFSASKLNWLIRNKPDIEDKLNSGDALIGTIDTYLIFRLTGGRTFATDHTNASRTLLFDIRELRWSADLCRLFGVPLEALPELRESSDSFGETDLDGLLDRPIPIRGVMGDSQASLFAQQCFLPGMVKMTLGTGSSILLNIGKTLKLSGDGAVSTIAWVLRGEPTYSFEGIISYAAATVSWLQNQLGLIDDPGDTGKMATAEKDNGGVYLVPAFAGLSAPYWSRTARAAIVGMTAHTNKNHVVRAALESIAYQIRDVLDMMQADADVQLKQIYCDGGASTNSFLMQFMSDMVGLELKVPDTFELSPLGAALSGALGIGIYTSLEDLSGLSRRFTTYEPQMDAQLVEKYYNGWKQAVARVL